MSRTASAVLALAIVGVSASCAARRFQPPSGPGETAPGAGDAWTQATTACRTVEAFAPTLRLSGRVEGQRLRGVQIQAALTKAGAIHLEAAAYGRQVFYFAGTSDQSTLFLPGENEVVRGRPDEIVEALIGIRLGPQRLLALLTGCVEPGPSAYVATRHGELLAFAMADGRRVFLKNENRWRAVAGEAPGFVVEYRRYAGDWPAEIRLWSDASTPSRAEITFKLDPPIVNPSLPQALFEVKVPPGASELTLDELKARFRR